MKSLAMSALYVFSIVLAVGIGMGQVGKESSVIGRDLPVVMDADDALRFRSIMTDYTHAISGVNTFSSEFRILSPMSTFEGEERVNFEKETFISRFRLMYGDESSHGETNFLSGQRTHLIASRNEPMPLLGVGEHVIESDFNPLPFSDVFGNARSAPAFGLFRFSRNEVVDIREFASNFSNLEVRETVLPTGQGQEANFTSGDFEVTVVFSSSHKNQIKSLVLNRKKGEGTRRFEYEVSSFVNVDGFFIPNRYETITTGPVRFQVRDATTGKLEWRYTVQDTREEREIFNVKINFPDSKDDYQLTTSIPDGNPVRMRDAPHIRHVWYDGRIVPKTEPTK